MQLLLFNAFNGLIQGAFYALMALGLALILSLNSVINMAHGGFLVIGAYLAYTLYPFLGFWGALVAGPLCAAGIGLVVERVLIRPLYKRPDPLYTLLLTFGLALVIEDMTRRIWGAQGLPFQVPDVLNSPVSSVLFFITGYRLLVVAITVIAVLGLYLVLRRTRLGIRIRAGTLDLETVSALGVNIYRLRALNFAIGCFLAGLAGVLAAGVLGLTPPRGSSLIMPSFVAVRWNNVTGGEDGLSGFQRQPLHFGDWIVDVRDETKSYYLLLACFAVATVIMRGLLASPLGHTWVAIRENRRRAQFLGVRVDLYIWAAFAISALFTALAGSLNAMLFNFTSPQDLHWILSGNFVIMIVLGGMRSFFGPLFGVVIFVVAQDYLSSLTDNWMTMIGLLFVLIVLLFPKGILGMIARQGRGGS
jgi:branched-chain amino acid transport system permease protein